MSKVYLYISVCNNKLPVYVTNQLNLKKTVPVGATLYVNGTAPLINSLVSTACFWNAMIFSPSLRFRFR